MVLTCRDDPCKNGGTCIERKYEIISRPSSYVCECSSGYSGSFCEIGMWSSPCLFIILHENKIYACLNRDYKTENCLKVLKNEIFYYVSWFFFSKHCKNKADESFADHNSYMCGSFDVNVLDYSSCHSLKVRCFTICFFPYILHYQDRRYMAEILPIWRKTIFNQSINQSINL